MIQNRLRGEEYRARAAAESAAGAVTVLEQVRAKHERAAQVWTGLADMEDARKAQREARVANPGALSIARAG